MNNLTGNYHKDCNILITANKKLEAERDALRLKLTDTAQELAELKVSKFKSLVESQRFYSNK